MLQPSTPAHRNQTKFGFRIDKWNFVIGSKNKAFEFKCPFGLALNSIQSPLVIKGEGWKQRFWGTQWEVQFSCKSLILMTTDMPSADSAHLYMMGKMPMLVTN